VRSPGGAAILIDGGPDPEQVATKLAALRVVRLDAMVATHPHLDHYEGLAAVLARVPTGVVLDGECPLAEGRSPPYLAFLRAVRAAGVPERHPVAGDVFVVGDVRIDILSPDRCWQGRTQIRTMTPWSSSCRAAPAGSCSLTSRRPQPSSSCWTAISPSPLPS
jgi:beta-lactamase superfamily II metal-dependent hydrolase